MKLDISDDEHFKQLIRRSRRDEFNQMAQILRHDHLVLYGEQGIGKTALLEAFRLENPLGYERIGFRSGYEIELDESLLAPYLIPRPVTRFNEPPGLLIIDGFQDIRSAAIKEKIATLMKEGRKTGYRVILSARRQINEKVFENNARTLRLQGLNERDIDRLVDIFYNERNEHPDAVLTIRELMQEFNGNPRAVLSALNMLVKDECEFIYQNPMLIEGLERPKIILEEPPKIITDIRLVNKKILDKIGRRPEAVYQLSPRQFEMMVAEIFEERGYSVELTKETRDGGKDLIILDQRDIGNFLIYAECKRYAPGNPVGVSVISDLIGRMSADRATAGMVITSSYFSPDAKTFKTKFEHQMQLIDFLKLSTMITKPDNK
ncbi:MAG: Restriction endonuclease [Mucilaginibacter sp.]|nr:Restriction endonuclease [Mucilaginibacter sp.]